MNQHLLIFGSVMVVVWLLVIYNWPRMLLYVVKRAILVKGFGEGPVPINTLYTQPQELFEEPGATMLVQTQTTTTHYHIQKKRRAEFLEEWRGYRQTVIRVEDVSLVPTARGLRSGVYMGRDGDRPPRGAASNRRGRVRQLDAPQLIRPGKANGSFATDSNRGSRGSTTCCVPLLSTPRLLKWYPSISISVRC